ncbi:MAG: DUF1467 family protein [Methylophilaceae bacterium]|nr:DUF1467 family protein [Methylophilaceae bacterium]
MASQKLAPTASLSCFFIQKISAALWLNSSKPSLCPSPSAQEAGEESPEGADPGAPLAPQLAKKAGLTTILSALVFVCISLATKFLYG